MELDDWVSEGGKVWGRYRVNGAVDAMWKKNG